MRGEAREIMKDVEIFGIDPLTALEDAAKKTPLDTFKDFLGGYASTVIIGGDIGHFLERKAEDIFKIRAMRVKAAAERLGMLLETFIIVMVMMSLCFYILFAVNNINNASGGQDLSAYSGIIMYTYLFTPMLSMLFIYLAHSMQPKNPRRRNAPVQSLRHMQRLWDNPIPTPHELYGATQLPVFTQLQAMGVDLPIAIAATLFVSTAPAAFVHMRLSKTKNSMEQGVKQLPTRPH